jgi:hypothetical protein
MRPETAKIKGKENFFQSNKKKIIKVKRGSSKERQVKGRKNDSVEMIKIFK